MEMDEFYEVLGLTPGASLDEIKKRYRDLSKEHHPDKGGNKTLFQNINNAYSMLTDPSYRNFNQKKVIELNFTIQVPIAFEDAVFGKTVIINYNRVELKSEEGGVKITEDLDVVTRVIKYPAGMMSGFVHLIENGGLKLGDRYGNAIVQFMTAVHPKFQTDGMNIMTEELVDLEIMLKGGEIDVQTMYGIKTVKVKPCTAPGNRLTIPGCGVKKAYNHYVIVKPDYPTEQDMRAKKKFKGLDIDWETHDKESEAEQLKKAASQFGNIFISFQNSNF